MRNASGDNSHRRYSFWGTPENCRYMRTLNARDSWNPSFGTIMVLETSKWCNEGDTVSFVVHDRDGFPFTGCCRMHRERSHQTQAFIFRDPYDESKIYRMGVSTGSYVLPALLTNSYFLFSEMELFLSPWSAVTWRCCFIQCVQSTVAIMALAIDSTTILSIQDPRHFGDYFPDSSAIC